MKKEVAPVSFNKVVVDARSYPEIQAAHDEIQRQVDLSTCPATRALQGAAMEAELRREEKAHDDIFNRLFDTVNKLNLVPGVKLDGSNSVLTFCGEDHETLTITPKSADNNPFAELLAMLAGDGGDGLGDARVA